MHELTLIVLLWLLEQTFSKSIVVYPMLVDSCYHMVYDAPPDFSMPIIIVVIVINAISTIRSHQIIAVALLILCTIINPKSIIVIIIS